jgi:2-polyprenyl-3-methyl-5-hydroxy-6-metoxy-1,4-benzoquinol methylase
MREHENPTPIIASWSANAGQWIEIMDNNELETRRLVTNKAVENTILHLKPSFVIDAGCGEGWLCRALQQHSVATLGVDAIGHLVENARQKGAGVYEQKSFEELIGISQWPARQADVVVFNFCLYEQDTTAQLLTAARNWVKTGGYVVVQTLHPFGLLLAGEAYEQGWKTEQWAGLAREFTHPYQWYYRTVADWVNLLQAAGWSLTQLQEPLHPHTKKPASLVLTGQKMF